MRGRGAGGDPTAHGARGHAGSMLLLLGRPEEAMGPLQTSIALAGTGHVAFPYWQTLLGQAKLHTASEDFGAEQFRAPLRTGNARFRDERQLYLAAALATAGQVEQAHGVAADVLARSPQLTAATLRARAASDNPRYLEQREALFRGLSLAGVPDRRG